MPLPQDILLFIQENFAVAEHPEILKMLESAKTEDANAATPRLLRCALVASDKTLKGLRRYIDGLAYDYRDVILAAEYAYNKGNPIQLWDLSKPFERSMPQKP